MGNPLSPLLSNLYMEYFETEIITRIKPKNMIWLRYVDDIFTYWDDRWGSFESFFNKLNNLAPSIKFKTEWETEGKLPFLDVLIIRDNNKYNFTVYRKPTFSASYIHFLSYHDVNVKIGVASNLFLRALRICSPNLLSSEFNIIRQQLCQLLYPNFIFEKALQKANIIYYKQDNESNRQSLENKIVIPYSEIIKKAALNLGRNNPFIFKYPKTIGTSVINVFQNKKDRSAGVYSIPCKGCDKIYVGQTGRSLSHRLIEHKRSVRYAQESSGIFLQVQDSGHNINWEEANLIFKSSCPYKRKIIESALINRNNNMNLSDGQWKNDIVDEKLLGPILRGLKDLDRPPDRNPN